jgi:transketolase N-terminal domain/subunit
VEKGILSPRQIRRIVLGQSKGAHVGHIGSALGIADIVAALYGRILRGDSPVAREIYSARLAPDASS